MYYSLHCYKIATEENILSATIFTVENRVLYCFNYQFKKNVIRDEIKLRISFRNVKMSATGLKTFLPTIQQMS